MKWGYMPTDFESWREKYVKENGGDLAVIREVKLEMERSTTSSDESCGHFFRDVCTFCLNWHPIRLGEMRANTQK